MYQKKTKAPISILLTALFTPCLDPPLGQGQGTVVTINFIISDPHSTPRATLAKRPYWLLRLVLVVRFDTTSACGHLLFTHYFSVISREK